MREMRGGAAPDFVSPHPGFACYINPVKHGLVTRVQDWPHSSFHRDMRRGIFPIDWAGDVDASGEFGEAL